MWEWEGYGEMKAHVKYLSIFYSSYIMLEENTCYCLSNHEMSSNKNAIFGELINDDFCERKQHLETESNGRGGKMSEFCYIKTMNEHNVIQSQYKV